MQFEDPKSVLEAAAARPTRQLDPLAVIAEGKRLRRARFAAATAGLAVAVTAASASFGFFGGDRDYARVPPAAPSEGGCREATGHAEAVRVAASLEDRLKREVRELRRLLRERRDDLTGLPQLDAGDRARRAPQLRHQAQALRETLEATQRELSRARERRVGVDERSDAARSACTRESAPPEKAALDRRVEAVVRHTECSLRTPAFVEPPVIGEDKWCTFEVVFVNHADHEVTLDDGARLLLVDDDATLVFSTAYVEGKASPRIADVRIRPRGTVTRELYFAVDPQTEPKSLVFGHGETSITVSLD